MAVGSADAGAMAPSMPDSGIDLYTGVGGSPEAVLASAGLKCLGGDMQAQMWPRDDAERAQIVADGYGDELPTIFRASSLTLTSLLPIRRAFRRGISRAKRRSM